MNDLDAWIDALISFRPGPGVFNPWRDDDVLDAGDGHGHIDRVLRLKRHLECEPMMLIVGEAPGYQGCRFSGVPFTNEKLILDGRIQRIAESRRITTRRLPFSEPSATIVWGALHNLGIADKVVMWNAFAFHPHKPDDPMSNRAPTKAELGQALSILRGMLRMFRGVPIVPIGRVAERTLSSLEIATLPAIRHPAMGGAKDFWTGLSDLSRIPGKQI